MFKSFKPFKLFKKKLQTLINRCPEPRYSLLIRHPDDAHGFKLKRSTQPLDHLRACRNHSIKARRLPRRAVAADADDGIDLRKVKQQRRLQPLVPGKVSHLNGGLDA